MEQWRTGEIGSQHGGQAGRDTAWLHVNPDSVHNWLQEWGGNLSKVTSLVSRITGQSPLWSGSFCIGCETFPPIEAIPGHLARR